MTSVLDHAKTKGMWAGALTPTKIPDLRGAVIELYVPEGSEAGDVPASTRAASEAGDGFSEAGDGFSEAGDGFSERGDGFDAGGFDADEVGCGASEVGSAADDLRAHGVHRPGSHPASHPASYPASHPASYPASEGASSVFTSGRPAQKERVRIVALELPHTPALLKAFDEIIVNATDHAKAQEGAGKRDRVTEIAVEFDPASGRVTVYNDGPGIPVRPHASASEKYGRLVYTVEVSFSEFLAGTNIVKDPSSVKGGINGLGAKIANAHSVWFEVETCTASGPYYAQVWRNRLEERGEPVVVADLARLAPAQRAPHTRVTFLPAYEALGYRLAGGRLPAAERAELEAWLLLRAHLAAAYMGPAVRVTYNGRLCQTTSAAGLAPLMAGERFSVLAAAAKARESPYREHPWQVAVVLLPAGEKGSKRVAMQTLGVVNGVVSCAGSHVSHFRSALSAAVDERLKKATRSKDESKISTSEALAGVYIVLVGAVPGADWSGQRKDELQLPAKAMDRYELPKAFLQKASSAIVERLLLAADTRAKRQETPDKYYPAKYAGTAKRAGTVLLAAEGDSAITFLTAGLGPSGGKGSEPGSPTRDWCGIISLQGVVMNAARQVTALPLKGGGATLVRSAGLTKNERLTALATAMGLRYDCAYTTPAELASLRYGQLVLCVDQDLDGIGKIAALVLVWVNTFWPALLAAGRVGRLYTPLIRAWPLRKADGPPAEFYYNSEFQAWLEASPARAKTHEAKYYKGLATHTERDVRAMFAPAAWKANLYTYTYDADAPRLFGVHFGGDPALRRAALATPVQYPSLADADAMRAARRVPIGAVQLAVDTKAYKLDAICRQIPGVADGLNPSRRKIVAGAFIRFAGERADKEIKVFQLGGAVADRVFYHHGDASLNATITYMAQSFLGARRFPYLIGEGQFGNRHGGRTGSAGSPRYIQVRLSPLAAAAFPPDDRWHLEYVFEDGQRAEPAFFVPVLPMAVLESNSNVSEGWQHKSVARDPAAVCRVVAALLAGDAGLLRALDAVAQGLAETGGVPSAAAEAIAAAEPLWPLPPNTAGYQSEVRTVRGQVCSVGVYRWDEAAYTVAILDLPIGVATAAYVTALGGEPGKEASRSARKPSPRGKSKADARAADRAERARKGERAAYVAAVDDYSSGERVDIRVTLVPGALQAVLAKYGSDELDPFEDLLMLAKPLTPALCYYGPRGNVLELGRSYLAAILIWAAERRELYRKRLVRERVVAQFKALEARFVARYIDEASAIDISAAADEALGEAALAARGYPRINSALLHQPKFTPNDELERAITAPPAASFSYILNLRARDLVGTARTARLAALAGFEDRLAHVDALLREAPFAGASLWRDEARALCKVAGIPDVFS